MVVFNCFDLKVNAIMGAIKNHRIGAASITIVAILLVMSCQTSLATSLRICSSFERDQIAANNSGQIWKVASQNMSPLLTPGSVVAVEKSVGFLHIQIGDIILFREPVPDGEEVDAIMSRVNEILVDPEDQLVLVTKGDANSGSIPGIDFPIYKRDYIGVVNCIME
jgi:signal peptidase I